MQKMNLSREIFFKKTGFLLSYMMLGITFVMPETTAIFKNFDPVKQNLFKLKLDEVKYLKICKLMVN